MFNKKQCKKCGNKIDQKDNFCSNCGFNLKNPEENMKKYGMLGKSDRPEQQEALPEMNNGMLNKMIQGAVKMIEKEIEKDMKDNKNQKNPPFKLMINGKEIGGNQQQQQKPQEPKKLPSKQLKGFVELPKQEPKTNIKRIEDKLVYELNMPEVKSIKDISIQKLENSIEIKAVSKDRAYKKIIPLNLPITDYNLSENKLILEMQEE